jgi:VanZ family protein
MAREIPRLLHRARHPMLLTCVGMWLIAAVATHVPAPELSGIHVSDKILHVVGFVGLATLFWLTLIAYGMQGWRRAVMVLGVMILYAAIDEKTQGWFHRDPDVADWLADAIGTVAAVIVWETLARLVHADRPRTAAKPDASARYEQNPW